MATPGEYAKQIVSDIKPYVDNGDVTAIICGLDFHASAIGGIAAAVLDLPLLIVSAHSAETISLMVPVGDINPVTDKYLYVDDFCDLGNTYNYVMEHKGNAKVVARYQAQLREYERI